MSGVSAKVQETLSKIHAAAPPCGQWPHGRKAGKLLQNTGNRGTFGACLIGNSVEKHREKSKIVSSVNGGRNNTQGRRPGAISIRDVAQRAGVSIATVSRAVNHIPTVNAELARRVWKAIEEVGYLPNTQARALVSGRSRMLGLIVSEITNPFFPNWCRSLRTWPWRRDMKC